MGTPRLSVIVLTWNEEANIVACLASLSRQTARDFEVIVIDAGSTDATVAFGQQAAPELGVPLRLHVGAPRMPIGAARNLGVAMAQAPLVAFVSADAELQSDWIDEAMRTLESADMAFGPQIHAPHKWTLGAAVRGLRYKFPFTPPRDPLVFASNVAAAYRKSLLQKFPFDAWANAAEDILLARRADAAGFVASYNARMIVRHHDVASLRQELRKNLREGRASGLYAREIGVQWPVLAWAALLAVGVAAMFVHLGLGFLLFAALLWLPALRRGLRRRRAMPARQLWAGIAASPVFDLAFLAQYLRGLVRGLVGARRHGRRHGPKRMDVPT